MAVPKKRTSHKKTRSRFAIWKKKYCKKANVVRQHLNTFFDLNSTFIFNTKLRKMKKEPFVIKPDSLPISDSNKIQQDFNKMSQEDHQFYFNLYRIYESIRVFYEMLDYLESDYLNS